MKSPALRVRFVLAVDLILIACAFLGSYAVRFGRDADVAAYLSGCWPLLAVSLTVRPIVYGLFGLYHTIWRYAGTHEMSRAVAASAVSATLVWLANFYVLPALGLSHIHSRSVLLLGSLMNLGFLVSSRFLLRVVLEWRYARYRRRFQATPPPQRRVLVVGAGDTGATVVREMLANGGLGMKPVAIVDEDPGKQGMRVHGVPVAGYLESIPQVAARRRVDEIAIALPAAPGPTMRQIRGLCRESGVPFRTVPGIYELLDGKASLTQLREVRVEDLLRREPVATDPAGVRAYVQGARVLVTGAGGSIGSEICRQVARHEPSQLLLLGHGEFSIFTIERELRRSFPWLSIHPIIADVRDGARLRRVMEEYRPAVVFHAAAHKHVPLMEGNVEEAFTNNVVGTQTVLDAAAAGGVERFVLVSTDKAVRPTSVMGTTKRIAELLVQEAAMRTGRAYVAVRFGNVLGSRGSAVPIFQEQIAAGGPVTVTHPEMRRYFMTIPEAVQLVLQAAALGQGGEVFVLDMGEPVKVADLVTDLIELAGLVPGEDIEIAYTGMRPGEKLYEELVLDGEHYAATAHEKVFMYHSNPAPARNGALLRQRIAEAAELSRTAGADQLVACLRELVPEFDPSVGAPQCRGVVPARA